YLTAMVFLCAIVPPCLCTLSLHDALPISRPGCPGARPHAPSGEQDRARAGARHSRRRRARCRCRARRVRACGSLLPSLLVGLGRSEEHTSELQSRENLVCRLLLEKKNKIK